jgi:hypothetical protein
LTQTIMPALDTGMKKISLLILGLSLSMAALCMANPQMGTWKLNESKSKMAPGMGKNTKVTYEAVGDQVKVTVDGVDAEGKASHNEWTGKFDGKDYAVTGDPDSDMRAYKLVDPNNLNITSKKNGKVTISGKVVVAKDGKSRTLTNSGTDPKGKKFKSVAFYDKE